MPSDPTVVLLYEGCVAFEVMLAMELLARVSQVRVATPDGRPHRSSLGVAIAADGDFDAAMTWSPRVVLIPGGDPGALLESRTAAPLLSRFEERQPVFAAICAGPLLLAQAGLLRGRRATHGFFHLHPEIIGPYFDGAEHTNDALVIDDRFITAQPQAHVAFAIAVASSAGVFPDDSEAGYRQRFYQGLVEPEERIRRLQIP